MLDPTWDDYYAAHWTRPITITTQSVITFITVSDDGVRLKYTGPGAPSGWNIVNKWYDHGRRVDIGRVTFDPGSYMLVLDWYERGGQAVIIVTAGVNNFSFTDTPKGGNTSSFPVINSTQYGDSSLILSRPIDLSGTTLPVLQFYTRYKMGGAIGTVEVSTDGGFTWTTDNLSSNTGGFSCPSGATCSPVVQWQEWNDDPSIWQLRQLNLSSYVPYGLINLRFHLVTSTSVNDGWYITDIAIGGSLATP